MPHPYKKSGQGFTLIEAVMVIAITGIIAGMVAVFIRVPVQGYIDSEARADLSGVAGPALRSMERDLRLALPNSVRLAAPGDGNQYVEFLLTKSGGRYLAAQDNPATGNILSFTDNSRRTFDVESPMPAGAQAIVNADFIVANNLGPGNSSWDAYACASASASPACNLAQVGGDPTGNAITMVNNPFGNQLLASSPSSRRFHVLGATPSVTYVCNPNAQTLTRYWNYAIQTSQPTNANAAPLSGASQALLATGVTGCNFSYNGGVTNAAGERYGLVSLELSMRAQNGDAFTLRRQVHVNNTP